MVYNREQAAKRAEASTSSTKGMCQLWTRTMFGAPSVGDVDGDKDADAVDGWKSEPVSKRHTDRNAPRGVPGAFKGGSRGFGHRVVCLGNGKVRTIDMKNGRYSPGSVSTETIATVERVLGVQWLGWSETISGQTIPLPPKPPAPPKTSRGVHVDAAIASLRKSKGTGERGRLIKEALDTLLKLPLIK